MEPIKCKGFKAAGMASGIKKNGLKDLGIIYSDVSAKAAGVFTKNRIAAAPVVLDKKRLASGVARAVIVNSGNANCCTGGDGMAAAERMSACVSRALGIADEQVLVSSTGVIGEPLPVEKIESAVPALAEKLSPEGLGDFAEAILTTDLALKTYSVSREIGGSTFALTGVAKGSGMIMPDMATMLAYVLTDADVEADDLKRMLKISSDRSFNRITVDGDTSTNDTVLLLANGLSGVCMDSPERLAVFQDALDEIMIALAKMVVRDGEGATKLVDVQVKGAESDSDAFKIAETVANSNLVKTALFGEDANWGRILGAAGRAGAEIDPDTIDIWFNDVQMVKNGAGCGKEAEALATEVLKQKEFAIIIDLNLKDGRDRMFTCDFSIDYVKINADYRS